jgi:hypothetical protein
MPCTEKRFVAFYKTLKKEGTLKESTYYIGVSETSLLKYPVREPHSWKTDLQSYLPSKGEPRNRSIASSRCLTLPQLGNQIKKYFSLF